jgi:hypothetical protein
VLLACEGFLEGADFRLNLPDTLGHLRRIHHGVDTR